jgi:hypothetical protein
VVVLVHYLRCGGGEEGGGRGTVWPPMAGVFMAQESAPFTRRQDLKRPPFQDVANNR